MSTPTVHPRPDFARPQAWQSLNGAWDFASDPDDVGLANDWQMPGSHTWTDTIQVPFPWESRGSGVERHWLPVGWYRRQVQCPLEWDSQRTFLIIGAAHYVASVWVNGQAVGTHTGGYLPFALDITDALEGDRAEIVVRVEAPLDKRFIPHGKQRSRPADDYDDCAFTPSSGIWQSVWLEARPATYVTDLKLRPTPALDGIEVTAQATGPHVVDAKVTLSIPGIENRTLALDESGRGTTVLELREPRLWSPQDPHLYDLVVELMSPDGTDRVSSYTGLRKVEVRGDRMFLNDVQLYVRGALDQGFWPEGIYAAPDDAALRRDVELALAAGFNLIRKHIKLEDPRWLYWADRLGLLVWAEPPCVGRYSPESVAAFEAQIEPMVARDGNHPCIIVWGLYNEEWGLDWKVGEDPERQVAVARAYDRLAAIDHTRPIVDNSGWWHVKTDLVDWHYYDMNMPTWSAVTAALAHDREAWFGHRLSSSVWYETQLSVPDHPHLQAPLLNGEYGGGDASNQGWLFRWQTLDLRQHAAFSGYIYTEFYDVEYEVVGLYRADRTLKDLGCDPEVINAETVLLFDLIPVQPGLDLKSIEGHASFRVRVSHHGHASVHGRLHWQWQGVPGVCGSAELVAQAFGFSELVMIDVDLPDSRDLARLNVWLTDVSGRQVAKGVLDIGRVTAKS